jgi:nicotinate dehydrogenase subunit A
VLVDDKPVRSCVTPLSTIGKSSVTTLEGLGTQDKLHALQKAFIDEQAAQCGYCIPGMIMSAKALLDANPKPTDADIIEALSGNLCRRGTHNRIVRAIKRAAAGGQA